MFVGITRSSTRTEQAAGGTRFGCAPIDVDVSKQKKRSQRRENAFHLLPGLKDVPVGRTQRSFLRAGLHQSMGVGRAEDYSVDNEEEVEVGRATKSEVINLEVESGNPVIDGRALKVSLSKKDVQVFGAVRLWDKTQRSTPRMRELDVTTNHCGHQGVQALWKTWLVSR